MWLTIHRMNQEQLENRRLQKEKSKQLQQEYFDTINNNAFTVCSRGAGNYSIRFYETLRSGRIPVLLDSDMVLPFEEDIDLPDEIIGYITENDLYPEN